MHFVFVLVAQAMHIGPKHPKQLEDMAKRVNQSAKQKQTLKQLLKQSQQPKKRTPVQKCPSCSQPLEGHLQSACVAAQSPAQKVATELD
jgi:hypothetical protein